MKQYTRIPRMDGAFYSVEDRDWFLIVAAEAARLTALRYAPYAEEEDLLSEAKIWAWSNPNRVDLFVDVSRTPEHEKRLRNVLCNYLAEFARREKARQLGFKPEDEVFYSLQVLRDALPAVYDHEAWMPSTAHDDVRIKGGDPAVGGELVATLADISRALDRLNKADRRVLYQRFGIGDSFEAVAVAERSTPEGARKLINRALTRLRRQLGGARPIPDAPEYIGSRRVMTNAQAQALTEGQ